MVESGVAMRFIRQLCYMALIVAISTASTPLWAAAPVGGEATGPGDTSAPTPARLYELGTEMVVRNWVLCVSRNLAERLAHASEKGIEQAHLAYADLAGDRSCGRFERLLVILRERIYRSPIGTQADTRVYAAEVNLANSWASVFVVYDGLTDD